jgi:hypothetical protein
MGTCVSKEMFAKQRSDEIDMQIMEDMTKIKRVCKILLLGAQSSLHLKGRQLTA